MDNRKQFGKWGEEKAAHFLKNQGYKIIEQNFKCRIGELDLIAMDGKTLVFIEVKTRKNMIYGLPCEAITIKKKKHIQNALRYYIAVHGFEDLDMRVDVIEILANAAGTYIRHIKNAL